MSPSTVRAATAVAALLLAVSVRATSVDINPVRVDLVGPGEPAELRLTNTGNSELSVQVDVFQWGQDGNGADQLTETDELLAVPPLFTIAPGDRQIVRIGYLSEPAPELEKSFRLLVTELAGPAEADHGGSGLAMRMRFSIPAFVAPSLATARAELELRDVATVDGGTVVTIANSGTGHARLSRVEVLGSDGWEALPESLAFRYLLPGALATVEIPPERGSLSAIRITSIDGRDWEYAVRTPNP